MAERWYDEEDQLQEKKQEQEIEIEDVEEVVDQEQLPLQLQEYTLALSVTNESGYQFVSRQGKKWKAVVDQEDLGVFDTPQLAALAVAKHRAAEQTDDAVMMDERLPSQLDGYQLEKTDTYKKDRSPYACVHRHGKKWKAVVGSHYVRRPGARSPD